jgi:hypothetical protein
MRLHLPVAALLLSASPAALGCGDAGPGGTDVVRVLFVGNSLTYTNDLPGMLERLAAAGGVVEIETRDVSQPNYALEDHWNTPMSRAALDDGDWDVVILQQGPSSLPESRVNLVTWAETWGGAIRAQGGVPALYMVWPDRSRLAFFDDVRGSYEAAAEAADGAFYPAGEAWRAAWARDSRLALYGPDDFHPSTLGTYLAALTIYRGITQREPPSLSSLALTPALDTLLHEAAAEAHSQYWRPASPDPALLR